MIRNARLRTTQLPSSLRLFWIVTVSLGLLCLLAELFCARILHLDGVYTWPTLTFYDCTDFRGFQPRFQHFHQLDFFSTDPARGISFGYPAPGALLYQLFYLFPWSPLVFFFVITLGGIALLLVPFAKAMLRAGLTRATVAWLLALTVVFSYPLWFEYLLGNMEICIVLIVSAGLLLFLQGRSYSAAACFAFAGSVKIFPLIYLGLLLSRRQYRQFLFGLLLLIPITLVSLWLVCPSIPVAWHGIEAGLAKFQSNYVLLLRTEELGFDHSLFGFLKQRIAFASVPQLTLALHLYLPLAALTGTVLYFTRIRHLPVINQILAFAVASILLPPLSYDYTLLHLYFPWALLVLLALRAANEGQAVPGLRRALLALALLFAPLTEFILYGVTWSGILKAPLLAALFVLALSFRFELPSTASQAPSLRTHTYPPSHQAA